MLMTFQKIPQEYESMRNQIQEEFTKNLYSNFNFKYFSISPTHNTQIQSNNIKNRNLRDYENILFNYLKEFRFIIFDFKSNLQTAIICIECECIIINQIEFSSVNKILSKLKENDSSIICATIDSPIDDDIKNEITKFYNYISRKLNFQVNNFINLTIYSIAAYMIRRHFYPSNYFKDSTFFQYNQHENSKEKKSKEILFKIMNSENKNELISNYNLLLEYFSTNYSYDDDDNDVEIQNFEKEDFIILRLIHYNQNANFYLAYHVKRFNVFVLKIINDKLKFKHEFDFCKNYSNRCMTKFHGFLFDKGEIKGFVYEFLSNYSLYLLIDKNPEKIGENFSFMTIIRIVQAIQYLHSIFLIHRDIKPSNILLDHNYLPYLSDFDAIRHPLNDHDDLQQNEITQDIGSLLYTPNECNSGVVSYPADIYSFGFTVYSLIDKKLTWDINKKPKMTQKSKMYNDLYELCTKFSAAERLTINKIKEILIEKINSLNIFDLYEIDNIDYNQIVQLIYECILLIQDENKCHINRLLNILLDFKYFLLENDDESQKNKLGNYYYERKEYLKAKKLFEMAAEYNNSDALTSLGILYYYGNGVEQNFLQAKEYFELAAEQNNAQAFNYLGNLYENGYAIGKILLKKAKSYYELSAIQNDQYAIKRLGIIHYKGYGVPKDYSTARLYLEKLVKYNNSYAILELGDLYYYGHGIDKDYNKAKEYYKKAAQQYNQFAYMALGKLYYHGYGVEKDYLKAKKYYECAAKFNNSKAYYKLGKLYHYGYGVKQNYFEAEKFYTYAAQLNNEDGLYYLGYLYSTCDFLGVDIEKAIKCFEKCIEIQEGDRIIYDFTVKSNIKIHVFNKYIHQSQNYLGLIYLLYYNDVEKAKQYIEESANVDFPFGQNNFGLLNQLIFKDQKQAKFFFKKASEKKFALAEFNLGYLKEKKGKIEESIKYYISALNDQKTPLKYMKFHYNDKIFDISKVFIICFINLKLSKHYFSQKNYDVSKYYFKNFFMSIMYDEYTFYFHFSNGNSNIFSYLKEYILNSPLFNLINNQKLSLNNKNIKETSTQFNLINNKLKEKQKSKEKHAQKSCNFILFNTDETDFNDPSQLFDFIKNEPQLKRIFIKEIQSILTIMENIIYTYPYAILFGRIIIPNPTKKEKIVKNIDKNFYEGLDIDEFNYKKS